MTDEKFLDQKL